MAATFVPFTDDEMVAARDTIRELQDAHDRFTEMHARLKIGMQDAKGAFERACPPSHPHRLLCEKICCQCKTISVADISIPKSVDSDNTDDHNQLAILTKILATRGINTNISGGCKSCKMSISYVLAVEKMRIDMKNAHAKYVEAIALIANLIRGLSLTCELSTRDPTVAPKVPKRQWGRAMTLHDAKEYAGALRARDLVKEMAVLQQFPMFKVCELHCKKSH